jgi:hypothetical protein
MATVQFHPYSEGRDAKVSRLDPKVKVATNTDTATTAPSTAARTGDA